MRKTRDRFFWIVACVLTLHFVSVDKAFASCEFVPTSVKIMKSSNEVRVYGVINNIERYWDLCVVGDQECAPIISISVAALLSGKELVVVNSDNDCDSESTPSKITDVLLRD